MSKKEIKGLLTEPIRVANEVIYKGLFTCQDAQWTGEGSDSVVTFTITAQEVADAARANLIWTDQNVQRGVKPGIPGDHDRDRELSLSRGYPDTDFYIFDVDKADDITTKLLNGEQVFLGPLIWNLRPKDFSAFWNKDEKELYIYDGKVYLPDSHHRQQAIIKAVRVWHEAPSSYPRFSPFKQFKVELYFLSREDEGNYFFDKNQLPKPTARSKAYDLTTQDDLSLLAKEVIEKSSNLRDNVNRVTDRLTSGNAQVVTLSTLREMMKTFAPSDSLDQAEMEGLSIVAAKFYDLLTEVRPELGHVASARRRVIRSELVVDAAVIMQGYAALMKDFNETIPRIGINRAINEWRNKLRRLSSDVVYTFGDWQGELFKKDNPLWQSVGIVKPGKDRRRLGVTNTGGGRSAAAEILSAITSVEEPQYDLTALVGEN